MELVCQELREENRRLEDDISRLQVRPAAANGRAEANSLNDGLGEKSGNPIDLSSDDSAARVQWGTR